MVTAIITANEGQQAALTMRQAVHETCVFAKHDDATREVTAPRFGNEKIGQALAHVGLVCWKRGKGVVAS